MTLMESLMALFGRTTTPPDAPVRAELDAQQSNIATRLSKLTGKKRDDVLAEAYRKADQLTEDYRLANGERRGHK